MESINDPSKATSLSPVSMNPIMTLSTKCREILVTSEPLAIAPSLVMYIVTGFVLATFAFWVEGKVRLFYFAVLIVLLVAFLGCTPQPARSF